MTTTVQNEMFTESTEELISGSEAIAIACALADVDVITAYPIRPYDTVMQYVSKLKADGAFDCDFIVAESEHSQFEIVKHASAVGARTFCGSSGVGWFYAFEAITVTAGLRMPVVAMVGNRALDDPGAFGVEHNDAMAVRDLGWHLYWVATAQEALDTALLAYKVAEDRRVLLPFAISCDGSFLTHSQAIVQVPTRAQVESYLPGYNRHELQLHPDNPITVAPQVNEDWLMEIAPPDRRGHAPRGGRGIRSLRRVQGSLRARRPEPVYRRVHDGGCRDNHRRHGNAGHAHPRGGAPDAGAGQEGRLRPREVLPPPSRWRKSRTRSREPRVLPSLTATTHTARPRSAGCCSTSFAPPCTRCRNGR